MVISPRLVIIRVGQITGASCFSKNSQDSHRYVESLRPVYRFAETPIETALINSLFGLRLGASFSKHPMHALKCAPNVAIHWKRMELHGLWKGRNDQLNSLSDDA
ncbi:hypothetical protein AV641_11280 [Pseudomonas fragi]|nr:hypothetical protein AV641_11280 [Pseudomonas fragi]